MSTALVTNADSCVAVLLDDPRPMLTWKDVAQRTCLGMLATGVGLNEAVADGRLATVTYRTGTFYMLTATGRASDALSRLRGGR